MVYRVVGHGVIVALASRDALHVEHNQPFVGEDPLVAKDTEGSYNLFFGDEYVAKLVLQFVDVDF